MYGAMMLDTLLETMKVVLKLKVLFEISPLAVYLFFPHNARLFRMSQLHGNLDLFTFRSISDS